MLNSVVSKRTAKDDPAETTHQLAVQQFLPLAEGYAVVKYQTAGKTGASAGERLPSIPAGVILRMLPALVSAATGQQATESESPSPVMPPQNVEFMERFAAQEQRLLAEDVAAGRLLTSTGMCARLGVSRQALHAAVADHRIFTLDGPNGKKLYPAFFADPRYQRAQLGQVSRALGDMPGDSKWDFFTNKKLSLNARTPLEVLASGNELDAVLVCASGFRDR